MAIGRLHMNVGGVGKARPHASYITRKGRQADDGTQERLEAQGIGNMPVWAKRSPVAFWRAADTYERANGTTYREMEIAIPRELPADIRTSLVQAFVRQEIGDRHAYQWVIRTTVSSDGDEHPHAHIMFSERQVDNIERTADQYFKRANGKVPTQGGARKGYGPHGGAWRSHKEASEDLKALRGRWEELANEYLARAGREERIDMRSYVDRGLDIQPAARLSRTEWRNTESRKNVIAYRHATVELAQAEKEGQHAIPDKEAQIIALESEHAIRTTTQAAACETEPKCS